MEDNEAERKEFHWKFLDEYLLLISCTQGFIQAILMSSTQHKKLNLLIVFLNSIFIKLYFKAYFSWTCIQIN